MLIDTTVYHSNLITRNKFPHLHFTTTNYRDLCRLAEKHLSNDMKLDR
jgi:hypothetical protein